MPELNKLTIDDWFATIAPAQKPPHEAIVNRLLSQFGIKSVIDVVKYMQSEEGKLMQTCLNQIIQREISTQKNLTSLQLLALRRKQHLAYLILSLKHDKEKAHQRMLKIEEAEQQRKLLNHKEKTSTISTANMPTPELELMQTMVHFQMARNALIDEINFTVSETAALESELQKLEEALSLLLTQRQFQRNFYAQFDNISTGTVITIAYIDAKIHEFIRAYQQEIITLQHMSTQNTINDSFIEHWNLLDNYQLQVNAWHDFKNTLTLGQSIVQRNGKLYLMSNHLTFDELSLEAQSKAHQAYLSLKPKLEKTRLRMEEEDAVQQEALETKRLELRQRIDFEQKKVTWLHSQLSTLDNSIIALSEVIERVTSDASQEQTASLQLRPKPQPNPSAQQKKSASTAPTPKPNPQVQKQLNLKLEMCALRCQQPAPVNALSSQQLSHIAAVERSRLIEEIKARPREIIPGSQVSPSLLSMLIAYNKTPLNIDRRTQHTPEQALESEKHTPSMAPRPSPFKKWDGSSS